ncbi:Organic hydroperoxide resistance protein-like 2 [Spiribacter salinus M19-40]|jgi:Ohr subfamily peroxiredoxin|uniref:Organic hydroperoxide resistance protein-like 2 n=1 Tax=Spiribacter salinus M19-40 TaxID=1260251 RepID=R4V7A8_9GAMM|nr:organic hydroperoxide resistance protein [Spiribacter salinus]AGM41759.1 Organic hydroperoxide resistance protein-like 2 [Spiribacter salinus M19-40]MBY5268691.1 organic hydroperoxide resistance protein [Spiribacter salinus]
MDVLYTTTGTATGGRDGQAKTADGSLDVKLTAPKELGGPGGEGTNPEQLFACGYSACFLGAMQFVGGQEGIKVPAETKVTATISLGKRDDGQGFNISADLDVNLPGVDQADAEKLVEKAHVVCPYSYATKGNVDVNTTLS